MRALALAWPIYNTSNCEQLLTWGHTEALTLTHLIDGMTDEETPKRIYKLTYRALLGRRAGTTVLPEGKTV